MWVGVNFNCTDVYAVLEKSNDRKFHAFATRHKANTYSKHLIHYIDDVSIYSLTRTENYDVIWNPRIVVFFLKMTNVGNFEWKASLLIQIGIVVKIFFFLISGIIKVK